MAAASIFLAAGVAAAVPELSVLEFGARPDGSNSAGALAHAMTSCAASGGCVLTFPHAGLESTTVYRTSSFAVCSNLTLVVPPEGQRTTRQIATTHRGRRCHGLSTRPCRATTVRTPVEQAVDPQSVVGCMVRTYRMSRLLVVARCMVAAVGGGARVIRIRHRDRSHCQATAPTATPQTRFEECALRE